MDIKIRTLAPLQQKTPCLVIGVCEKGFSAPLLKELDQALNGVIGKASRSGEFTGKALELMSLYPAAETVAAQRILLVGLGSAQELSAEGLRQAAGAVMKPLMAMKTDRASLALPQAKKIDSATAAQCMAEGLLLASYRYQRFLGAKAVEERVVPQELTLLLENKDDKAACENALERAQNLCAGVTLARDLVNEPGNVKSPAYLAQQAQAAAAQGQMECSILERAELEEQGFGALLGVAQGSEREPCLIVLEHRGADAKQPPVALVGKGVVFDAGGISLKPAEKMDEMKMDMAGGAAVIGAMLAASLLKLPINLVGVVPAVENMPSGGAIRPGDILTSLSGKTIEVLNTDAEGRLILADALTYVKRFNPKMIVDLATLTGACIIALGHHASAVLGNDDKLVRKLLAAGEASGERLWQLPLWPDYSKQIKSEVADVKNMGGRPAGTVTAAAFLQEFADDQCWAHLDIAGTAWRDQEQPYIPKGGTGVGVRLLVSFLQELTAE
ncbi:MAG: leucyl aminopeptidase [Desulfuromonadales bacterium]|nr:leucyl aminopeptidase [Desulfuromonadales bacterium]